MSTDQQIAQLCQLVKEQQAQITTLVVAITMQQGNIAQLIHGQVLLTQAVGALLGEEMGQPVQAEQQGHSDEGQTLPGLETLDPDDD